MVSRAICGSGLHPTLGSFIQTATMAFALSDNGFISRSLGHIQFHE